MELQLAHGAADAGPGWTGLFLGLGAAVGVTAYLLRRVPGGRDLMSRPGIVALVLGAAVVALALSPPLESLAQRSFALHMTQHVALVALAAPLLALARPLLALWVSLPVAARRIIRRAASSARLDRAARSLQRPQVAWLAAVALLWVWHVPALFEGALMSDALHAAEHLSLLATSLLFWSVVFTRRPRLSDAGASLYVFTGGLAGGALGALITFSGTLWYEAYAPGVLLDPATDQALAGIVMWVPAGLIHVGIALVFMHRWLTGLESRHAALPQEQG